MMYSYDPNGSRNSIVLTNDDSFSNNRYGPAAAAEGHNRDSIRLVNHRLEEQSVYGDSCWIRNSCRKLDASGMTNNRGLAFGDTCWMRTSSRRLIQNNQSNNRSVSFAKGTMFDAAAGKGTDSSSRRRTTNSRVAHIKAKLTKSTPADDMDASWGGFLTEDLSSGSSRDSNEDSLGDFGLDSSRNFAQNSTSFNMSFMKVGVEDLDALDRSFDKSMNASSRLRSKVTGRGSIFVIPDDRFGKTKVVQVRLEKAAKKLQRFLRRYLLVLRQYSDEAKYLKSEIEDVENRRKEELADVARHIEQEKEQLRMEFEQEWSSNQLTPEEWEAFHKDQEDTKAAIAALKEENEQIRKDCKELQRKNDQLAIVDPERENEVRSLETQIQKMQLDQMDWQRIRDSYSNAVQEAQFKLDLLMENRKTKRAHRKRMEQAIANITKLVEEQQAEKNPKLVEKLQKKKAKIEKKLKKLKAKTLFEQQGQIANTVDEGEEVEEPKQEERHERRRSSQNQRQEASLPDLDEAVPRAQIALEKQKAEERLDTKKAMQIDDLPERLAINPTKIQEGAGESEDKAAKKKKKKGKEKDKQDKKKKDKDKKKDKKSGTSDDPTLMRIYEDAAKKKGEMRKKEDEVSAHQGALMALFM